MKTNTVSRYCVFNLRLMKTNTKKHCLPTGSKGWPEKLRVLFTIAASHAISIFFLLKFTSQLYKVKIHKPRMHKVRAASKCNNLVSPSVSPVLPTS